MSAVWDRSQVHSEGKSGPCSLSHHDPRPRIEPHEASGTGSFQKTKMLFPQSPGGLVHGTRLSEVLHAQQLAAVLHSHAHCASFKSDKHTAPRAKTQPKASHSTPPARHSLRQAAAQRSPAQSDLSSCATRCSQTQPPWSPYSCTCIL